MSGGAAGAPSGGGGDLPPRVLGLDWGTRRVGVAVSDPFGETALPLAVLPADREEVLWPSLRKICDDKDIRLIVVGLPVNMDGSRGPAASAASAFAARAAKETGLPVETIDERLTSADADGRLAETGMRWKERKKRVDQVAASLILASWLERRARRSGPPRTEPAPPPQSRAVEEEGGK
jgi:putative Holliday junction resolvase